MISFKSFLTEARMAPLYHGTTLTAAAGIIRDDYFIPNTNERHLKGGTLSLTRSFNFAKNWSTGLVFEFDQQKLIQNYKVKPYNFFSHVMKSARVTAAHNDSMAQLLNQYEEALIGKLTNLKKYIVAIHVPNGWFEMYKDDERFKTLQKFNVIGY